MEQLSFFMEAGLQVLAGVLLLFLVTFIGYTFFGKANSFTAKLQNFVASLGNEDNRTQLLMWYKAHEGREAIVDVWQRQYYSLSLLEDFLRKEGKLRRLGQTTWSGEKSYIMYRWYKTGYPVVYLMAEIRINQGHPNTAGYDIPKGCRGEAINLYMVTESVESGDAVLDFIAAKKEEFAWTVKKSTVSEEETATYYTLGKNRDGSIYKASTEVIGLKKFADALSANMLSNTDILLQGAKINVNLAQLVVSLVKNYHEWPINGLLFGGPGTGKTSLLRAICYYLSRFNPAVNVILTDANTLFGGSDTAFQEFLAQETARYNEEVKLFGEGTPTIILLDELDAVIQASSDGHKTVANSQIAQLMDGVSSQSSGIRILGTVNLPKNEIRPEILRSNRTHLLVEFHPLSSDEALSVAKYVKANLDKGFTFDQEKFDALVKGQITLADIYGCSLPQGINNIVKGIVDELESQMVSSFDEAAKELQDWSSTEEEKVEEENLDPTTITLHTLKEAVETRNTAPASLLKATPYQNKRNKKRRK